MFPVRHRKHLAAIPPRVQTNFQALDNSRGNGKCAGSITLVIDYILTLDPLRAALGVRAPQRLVEL